MASPSAPLPETPSTLPTPPFVPLKGISNFRDLGGDPIAADGSKSVRRNYIYRCAEPTRATDEAVDTIRSLGITHIFDLRSRPEIEKLQVAAGASGKVIEWAGVERVYSPVFPETSFDPASIATRLAHFQTPDGSGFTLIYKEILEGGKESYGKILRHILQHPPPGNGFVVHCTAGKDRTGVFSALVLSLCGVSDEVVAEEFALTEKGNEMFDLQLMEAFRTHAGVGGDAPKRMVRAKKEYMLSALQLIKTDFGGAEGYFKACGLSDEELDKIKSLLVVDEKPVHKGY